MDIKKLVISPKGSVLADIGNGKYVAKANTMELAICHKVESGYMVDKCVLAGFMMRTDADFTTAVKNLKESEL